MSNERGSAVLDLYSRALFAKLNKDAGDSAVPPQYPVDRPCHRRDHDSVHRIHNLEKAVSQLSGSQVAGHVSRRLADPRTLKHGGQYCARCRKFPLWSEERRSFIPV